MHDGAYRSPAPILAPGSVAIVGASERAKWPIKINENLTRFGYSGRVYPINPRYDEVWGRKCYPDFASLPEAPDHALFIVPAKAVLTTLEEAAEAGLRAATIYASGIGEGSNPEIVERGETLKKLVREHGITLAGPNCMGAMSMREKYFVYPNDELCMLPTGGTAVVFQSGGTLQFWARTAASRGVRFSYLVSSGNEIALDLADYVNFMVDDPHTRIIVLFIEGIRRPEAFMAAASRALAAGKPIVAIKTGRSEKSRAAARSHTGAISGDHDVFTAMCERHGIINCDTLDDMVDVVLAFQAGRLPKGRRVGVFTTSGGTVDLLYDYVEDLGGSLTMPDFAPETKANIRKVLPPDIDVKNPLDAGIPSDTATAAAICSAIADDPNVDILAMAGQLPSGTRGMRDVTSLRAMFEGTEKPVIGFGRMRYPLGEDALDVQEGSGFPFLQGLPPTLRALEALSFYAERVGRVVPRPLPADGPECPEPEGEAFEALLSTHGLTLPRSARARRPAEAGRAAASIGFPVALKVLSPQFSHKTEIGGVRLGLRTAAEVEEAAAELEAAIAARAPDATIEGFLVQEMVEGVEIILGAREDPLYGPMILVGAGGILVELVRDVAIRLLPIGPDDARAMLAELEVSKLLAGFRGRPAADVEALVAAICGLSDLYLAHRGRLAELEINPLIVLAEGKGVRAVDVRPVFATASTQAGT